MSTKSKKKPHARVARRRTEPAQPEPAITSPDAPASHAWAIVLIHANGRPANIALCGARTTGSPPGDPVAWSGAPLERLVVIDAMLRELATWKAATAASTRLLIGGRVEVCPGCDGNLTKMREKIARQAGRTGVQIGEAPAP